MHREHPAAPAAGHLVHLAAAAGKRASPLRSKHLQFWRSTPGEQLPADCWETSLAKRTVPQLLGRLGMAGVGRLDGLGWLGVPTHSAFHALHCSGALHLDTDCRWKKEQKKKKKEKKGKKEKKSKKEKRSKHKRRSRRSDSGSSGSSSESD